MLGRSWTSDAVWDLLNENCSFLHKWYVPMNTLLHLYLVSSARIKRPAHSLCKYFWSTTYTGLAWFNDTEKTWRHLLPRSSQAGRKNKNKTWKDGIAYTWQKNEDCPVRGLGSSARGLQSHKCSHRTCWVRMVVSMEQAQCTGQTWSLLSRAYKLANVLTRNRK